MATTKNSYYKVFNGTDYDTHYLKTTADQVIENTTKQFVTATDKTNWNGMLTAANVYTDQEIAELVNSAPATLDTLKELSTALENNPNFATSMTTTLATKASYDTTTLPTGGQIAVFHSDQTANRGKIITTGFTINTSVPAGAVFTDTKPGTLTTTSTTSLTTASSESLTGTINLHKVAKTGAYADLVGLPTYDNYAKWVLKANSESTGLDITSAGSVNFVGGGGTTVSRSSGTITITSTTGTVYNSFVGSSATVDGSSGLVPAPLKANVNHFLKGDGTWSAVPDTSFSPSTLTIQGNGTSVQTFDARANKVFNVKPGSNISITNDTANGAITINNTYAYTHPTTSGSSHIPSGGAANNILKWSSDGVAVWAAISGKINNIAYSGFTDITIPGATVGTASPASPVIGSIWIDTNA